MIGHTIRQVRKKKKITQQDLAERLGVSRQAICMWEKGKRELKLKTLTRIARIFGMPLRQIVREDAIDSERHVRFELEAPAAKRVVVTGDFNYWDANGIQLTKRQGGRWSADLFLKPGIYQYKFIVDDQWTTDPLNAVSVISPYGGENSVKEVR